MVTSNLRLMIRNGLMETLPSAPVVDVLSKTQFEPIGLYFLISRSESYLIYLLTFLMSKSGSQLIMIFNSLLMDMKYPTELTFMRDVLHMIVLCSRFLLPF